MDLLFLRVLVTVSFAEHLFGSLKCTICHRLAFGMPVEFIDDLTIS